MIEPNLLGNNLNFFVYIVKSIHGVMVFNGSESRAKGLSST